MIALIRFLLAMLTSPFKSRSRLEAENAALRQQLIVLRRKVKGRARLTNGDRWFLSSCTDGSLRFSRPSRLFVPRRCCVGIGRAFVITGVGNHDYEEGDRKFAQSCVRSYGK